jgi:hypothetical protein
MYDEYSSHILCTREYALIHTLWSLHLYNEGTYSTGRIYDGVSTHTLSLGEYVLIHIVYSLHLCKEDIHTHRYYLEEHMSNTCRDPQDSMLHFTCLSPLPYRREGDVHYILVHHSWLYRLACPQASRTHTGSLSEALLLFKEEVKTPQNKGIQKSEINDEQPFSTRDRG